MEVAGLWSQLPALYGSVLAALRTGAKTGRCYFSHVYGSGACLYYTFVLRDADDQAVEKRYESVWDQIATSCVEAGGTLTHHHGIGRLKTRYLDQELGTEGARLLRRIKKLLDPQGIFNPGALVSEG